jgi:hypothetical protein
MENKLFKTDYTKKLYKIEIIVCQNGNEFRVEPIEKDHNISYDSLIGTLEITKIGLIDKQRKMNKKQFKKQKEQVEQAEPRLLNCYEILGIKQPNKPNKNK